jgi:hypothetical protein
MILIGVGSLITLIAILAYLVIRSAVIRDAVPARYLALPFAILFVGVAMIVNGARRLRRS